MNSGKSRPSARCRKNRQAHSNTMAMGQAAPLGLLRD